MSKVYVSPEEIVTEFLQHYGVQFEEEMKKIYLCDKEITELPIEFGSAFTTNSLMMFGLSCNKIEELPDSICTLRSLKLLFCRSNKLVKLPEEIGALKNLKLLPKRITLP
eukprot:TRINITY_DN891_c2_g1_i1.p1 TRINITY_DN891_c2_g1~~TRINITY_DN891_c2_g1_i1.p1  ORF type:complete len:110 (+),score=17.96 TRINITY_DN891_c2_g1_i1:109-438(+)